MSPGVIDQLLSDIRESAAVQMLNPGAAANGAAAMYGMAAQIPDRLDTLIDTFEFCFPSMDYHVCS